MSSVALDVIKARSAFPALAQGFIFADNAGGSQVTQTVIDHISDYLTNTNVQLGADYAVSAESARRVDLGPIVAAKLFNAALPEEVAFGGSSTMNLENLARGLEGDIHPGEEFVITGEHEANVGPWKKLATRRGAVIRRWQPTLLTPGNPYSVALRIEDLVPLITAKTRVVAITACSNILGTIIPVKEVVQAVRKAAAEAGARKLEVSVDCVAYAPHRRIDVQDWDVDFCVFSFYKLYGPHCSALYVRKASLETSVTALTHHFIKHGDTSYKLQPGGTGYELVYSTTAVLPCLLSLSPSNELAASFALIATHEQTLLAPLLAFLTNEVVVTRGVRIVGSHELGLNRVPTVSFVVGGDRPMKSRDVVSIFDAKGGMGIRFGHFYAYTLVDDLTPKLDIDDGVVRISLVHYNTVQEVKALLEVLKETLNVDVEI